jgi:hypothetical protein
MVILTNKIQPFKFAALNSIFQSSSNSIKLYLFFLIESVFFQTQKTLFLFLNFHNINQYLILPRFAADNTGYDLNSLFVENSISKVDQVKSILSKSKSCSNPDLSTTVQVKIS